MAKPMTESKELQITMTAAELDAFGKRILAEDRAQRELEAEQSRVVAIPPDGPGVYRTPPANPEFEAELLKALDAENGDPGKAAVRVLQSVESSAPPQPLAQLFNEWRHPFFGPYTAGLLKTYILNLKARRERDARREREKAGA